MDENLSDLPQHLCIKHTHFINTTASALYIIVCHLVTAHQQIQVHSTVEQGILHLQNSKWFDTSLITSWMSPVKKKKMKNSTLQQLHWMMTVGWMNLYWIDTYASMNCHNHITCALTLAHIAWISYTSLQNRYQHCSTWT